MVLGSWLEPCPRAEVAVGWSFPTSLLWLPWPARTGTCLLLNGPAVSVDFQWSFTCTTYPSLSWILESLYHISALVLFVRNEKVSLEPWWLNLQSLNTEVWSDFENNSWLLGQCRRALAMFHSYFLVITNS